MPYVPYDQCLKIFLQVCRGYHEDLATAVLERAAHMCPIWYLQEYLKRMTPEDLDRLVSTFRVRTNATKSDRATPQNFYHQLYSAGFPGLPLHAKTYVPTECLVSVTFS